ncbi:putative extracellular nuclease [Neolewinella xylanilytica]|uniref:Putative extracellular nuclease n=1 Tax=Neolewinella xylanilytica TaxID=1514080 RepID=A0A2S6IAN9_9BACT|nr:ExeM/NucH family extracellular endonuclease [Neolewinella xylanilytica]PPK88558.1 putative extracellular nuclease [Neolewinella xylanilytica]
MRFSTLLLFLLLWCQVNAQDRVIITGLLDGTLSGATPRALELYVEGTVDLSGYRIQRFANGGTDPTDIALTGTFTDAFVYVVNGTENFTAAFGDQGDFANVIASGAVTGTGNDAFALVAGSTVVDVVGGPIGGPEADIYQDSYLYRKRGTSATGSWTAADWDIPGNDLLDGLDAAQIGALVPFGTYAPGEPRPTITISGEPLNESQTETYEGFSVELSEAPASELTVAYELYGTATEGTDYQRESVSDTLRFPTGERFQRVLFLAIDDALIEGTETIGLRITYLSDSSYLAGPGTTLDLIDDDLGTDPIGIHLVQGDGAASPLVGNVVTVDAIVTADFTAGLDGFYLQEEDADTDNDPMTSEGIFVYAPDAEVMVGDRVTLTAEVEEFFGQTQLDGADAGATLVINGNAFPVPAPTVLMLPTPDSLLESLEGMLVQPQDLVITNLNGLDRFGEVEVTSGERLVQFTECNDPDPQALNAYLDSLERDVIVLDDARSGTNAQPILLPDGSVLAGDNSLRAGQTIAGLTGVLGYGFNRYRIQPTDRTAVTLTGNERPVTAPEQTGEVRVVSANVLNYFTTLGSRGADTETELRRQEAKIVAALNAMDADVVGLIEIENNDFVALRRLVDTLNSVSDRGYTYVESPNTGDDEIMVALIYDTLRIAEAGTAATLATPESLFVGPGSNRVPLAQTFRVIDTTDGNPGGVFTVCVNHFKSKGSGCGEGDDDDGGAGNCNGTRTAAAEALADWLATNPTGVADTGVLIIGDLNSYRMEDPIDVLLDAGYVNTKTLTDAGFPCAGGPPSYVFGGFWGSLDYALASASLTTFVTMATAWTVNAPEPEILDYNQEGAGDSLYAPDFYRFSDHDPIIVDLDFSPIIDGVGYGATENSTIRLERRDATTYTLTGLNGRAAYFLTNLSGQVLATGTVTRGEANAITTAGLHTGIYFLTVREAGKGPVTFKILTP